jgi:predicted acyltransferase
MATTFAADSEPSSIPAKTSQPSSERLLSLDALRGFDMFWIVGGREVVFAILTVLAAKHWLVSETVPGWFKKFMEHPDWNGFSAYDLIFPLFIFMAGVSMPFSFAKHVARGESRGQLYWKITRRAVLLVLLGLICQGLLKFDFANLRCASVLGRIGLAYFFAALISFHTSTRGRVAWIVVILLGYWAAMMLIPVPGFGAGNLQPGQTLADWIDRRFLPGKLYKIVRDPEGILSTIPAIATCLLGVLAGQWLRESRRSGLVRAAALLIAGAVCLLLGGLWSQSFPLNKNLWTSSFVLWAGGWSLLLLGLFYLVIDVWGWKKWAFFFAVIGVNAITIYVGHDFIDFPAVGQLIFSREPIYKALLLPSATVATEWLFLYVLYRSRIFLRL